MKLKNENKLILKQWVRVFFLIVIVAMLAFSIYLISSSVSKNDEKKELYSYSYNSNLDYKVYLKPNSFFNSPYIEMNKQYITSLIDYINVDAHYTLQSTKELEYTYSYDIIATLKGAYQSGEASSVELWSKVYTIAPSETRTIVGNKIAITKNVKIDYKQYNQIMNNFRESFGLSIDAAVDLALRVKVSGKEVGSNEISLQENETFALNIPLLAQTIQIKPDYINSGREIVYANSNDLDDVNIPMLVIGVALLLLMLLLLVKLWKSLVKVTKKSEYVIALNKILKEHADIIAESINLPDLSQYDVVNIKHFRDLVDIEEELRSPILYTEVREDYASWFIIIKDQTAYKFVLKQSDFIRFNQ